MNKTTRNAIIVLAVAGAVAVAIMLRTNEPDGPESTAPELQGPPTLVLPAAETAMAPEGKTTSPAPAATLPKLVDLGADKCIPCKMMKPILDELERDFAEKFTVEFVDVWKNPQPGRDLGIQVIPTQIFFDEEGEELFRHEGFFSKEDILANWKRHGVDVDEPAE